MTRHHTITHKNTEIIQIVTGIWKENCYIINNRAQETLGVIDPGDNAKEIIDAIEACSAPIASVLLTHAHYDHLGAANELCERYNTNCHIHERDLFLLKRAPLYAMSFEKKPLTVPKRIKTFSDDAEFFIGHLALRVIPAPGHTPGGVCFLNEDFMFCGDTLMFETHGRTDLPGGDQQTITATLERLITMVPGNPVLYPGHGKPWSMQEARLWHRQQQNNLSQ